MGQEAKLQSVVSRWLKSKGCYVIKANAGPGVPVGCPDLVALIPGGGWVALEIKATANSKFQPLQKETVARLDEMYYSKVVHVDNWADIKAELEGLI